mgnify:CR=1 FL=1
MTTRILLADDHALVRRGVRMILDAEPDLEVVAEAGDGAEAVEFAREHRPDLAVLDVSMPGEDGYSLIRRVRALPSCVRKTSSSSTTRILCTAPLHRKGRAAAGTHVSR